jgi:hypothetical protein
MMSCIFILYIAVFPPAAARAIVTTPAGTAASAQSDTHAGASSDPDALYANRSDLASARQAAAIWAARLKQNPKDFTSAAKLARVYYWLGGHAGEAERKSLLEQGIAYGRTAVAIEPNRPEGHFWIAANMGSLAESFGLRQGLKYKGEIRDELTTVLRLDPAFQHGSADRALGRWYYKVPGLFGGSNAKSEEHLRKSLTYGAGSTTSLYFLAETLVAERKYQEARDVLQQLKDTPGDPDWAPEDREFKAKGQQLLATMKR